MIKGKDILCISSIDWNFNWQGHQEIMAALAAEGNRVLFIENTGVRTPGIKDLSRISSRLRSWITNVKGFRKERENLFIYSPVILPFPYSRTARWINRRMLIRPLQKWLRLMRFQPDIIWTFLPTHTALDIIDQIDHEILVYYCIADFYELTGRSTKSRKAEQELLSRCDLVFAQGEDLARKCRAHARSVHIFPFGVNWKNFAQSVDGMPEPRDLARLPHPRIGYVGGIHRHIDLALVHALATGHPQWSFIMVGPQQTHTPLLENLPNVYFIGAKPFPELPAYVSRFDVCLIPYLKSEYTATVYPTKLNEYHAAGRPVVSTDIPEVIRYNRDHGDIVYLAGTAEEFSRQIEKALAEDSPHLETARRQAASTHSWETRIEQMSTHMERALQDKSGRREEWGKLLRTLYRRSRHKVFKALAVFACAYGLLFYTPAVWILSRPLMVTDAPEKADAIAVFAGGVGESGKAEQGYEERLSHAIDLYRSGYAPRIILSSGYTYFFKEAEVMKRLAMAEGVPESALILEERSANTVDYVRNAAGILRQHGWSRVLVVSSPYHGRRIRMTFQKHAPDIRARITPIANSLFFDHAAFDAKGKRIWKRISFRQAKALAHEYCAIAYYWLTPGKARSGHAPH
jgi:uncharacterized SAM-binding protein YcdF (DUF218 family)/glycosyltransferase involved in cell wall biosynthesis